METDKVDWKLLIDDSVKADIVKMQQGNMMKELKNRGEGEFSKCVVDIEGMTCMSCVNTITEMISAKNGIEKVFVSLENNEGNFTYDDKLISAQEIADSIEDMGFGAELKKVNDSVIVNSTKLMAEEANVKKIPQKIIERCFLHIDGIT